MLTSRQDSDPYIVGPSALVTANDVLDKVSETEDFSQSCNGILFIHDDFNTGVLGLAWLADPGPFRSGGLCDASAGQSFNTLVATDLRLADHCCSTSTHPIAVEGETSRRAPWSLSRRTSLATAGVW